MTQQPVTRNDPKVIEERMRVFLAVSAVLIAILSLILYGIRADPALLLTTGISGIGLTSILPYYFKQRR